MENKLWMLGILGTHSPKALLMPYFSIKAFMRGARACRPLFHSAFAGYRPNPLYSCGKRVKKHSGEVSDLTDGKTVTLVHSQGIHSHMMFLIFTCQRVKQSSWCVCQRVKQSRPPTAFILSLCLYSPKFACGFGAHKLKKLKVIMNN